VSSWVRSFNFTRGRRIEIEERIRLSEYVAPSEVMLVTPYEVALESAGVLRLTSEGDVRHVRFDPRKVSARIEELNPTDNESVVRRWGRLHRIHLVVKGNGMINTVKYTID